MDSPSNSNFLEQEDKVLLTNKSWGGESEGFWGSVCTQLPIFTGKKQMHLMKSNLSDVKCSTVYTII